MMRKILTGWSFFFIGFFVGADSQEIIQVDVLNKSQIVSRIFKNTDDVNGFQKIWEDKALLKDITNIGAWDYLLDVQTKVTSIQWRYDSKTGLCSPFTKKKMPLYRIRDFEILNKAIHALPHQKIVWEVPDEPLDLKHEPWIPPYDPREGRRENRQPQGGSDDWDRNRDKQNKSLMPVFQPYLDGKKEKDHKWKDDSRKVYISLEEARRRRDASRAKKAESEPQMDSQKLP